MRNFRSTKVGNFQSQLTRTPTRITITVNADLNRTLCDYRKLYAATHGVSEKIADLIPFMLEAFLDSGRTFARVRKEGLPEVDAEKRRQSPA